MGKSGADADAYAQEVVKADFEESGEEDVFRKVRSDLDKAGGKVTDEEIRVAMLEFLAKAAEQIKNG